MPQYKSFPPKHPTAKLDYRFDWAALKNHTGLSNWLREDEVIISHTVTVPEGITKVSDDLVDDDTAVVVWLEGGSADETYLIQCSIETNQAREDTRSMNLLVRSR